MAASKMQHVRTTGAARYELHGSRVLATITLEDGTTLTLAESAGTTGLNEGIRVIATYEEKGRHKVATSVILVWEAPNS